MTKRAHCLFLWAGIAAPACSGAITDAAGDETVGGAAGTGAGGGAGSVDRADGPLPAAPLRRLTRTEYNFTVRDLLGDTSSPGNALPADAVSRVFDNSAGGLKIDDVAFEAYEQVAESVIDRATRAGSQARSRLYPCSPATGGPTCARRIIAGFARKAWRRPVAADEVDDLMTALDDATAIGGTIDDGVKVALRSILSAPSFLYRVEIDPPNQAGEHAVSPHELATRLSYFIYSSMPDDELSARADDETLLDPAVVVAQARRMLADAKADALVTNFAAQWLDTGAILRPEIGPDPVKYPLLDDSLRHAMKMETERFFSTFLQGDRNVTDMLDADFTFVNARLARYYGMFGVTGTSPQQISLAGTPRRGLLTQAAMLTSTSGRDRTSYTRRGNFILTRLLCTEVGNPPADAMDQPPDPNLPANPTAKQIAASHLRNDACKGCHALMDPLGFGLEAFGPAGLPRDRYAKGAPIDATGQLPGGASFDGAPGLAAVLKNDARYPRCLAQQLYTFGLGREPSGSVDQAYVDSLTLAHRGKGGRIRELVLDLVQRKVFTSRALTP